MSKKHTINKELLEYIDDEIQEEATIEHANAVEARKYGFIKEAEQHVRNCANILNSRIRYTLDNNNQ